MPPRPKRNERVNLAAGDDLRGNKREQLLVAMSDWLL